MVGAQSADFQTLPALHKALVDGLPKGMAFEERVPIFCEIFDLSWDDFKAEEGPSRDTLEKWASGLRLPEKAMLDKLAASAKKALMKLKGFRAPTAARAARWLKSGAVSVAQLPQMGGHECGPSGASGIADSPDRLDEWLAGLEALEAAFLSKLKRSSNPLVVVRTVRKLFSKANGLLNSMLLSPGPEFRPDQCQEALEATHYLGELAEDAVRLSYRSWDYERAQGPLIRDCDEVSSLATSLRAALSYAFEGQSELFEVIRLSEPAEATASTQPSGLREKLLARFSKSDNQEMGCAK